MLSLGYAVLLQLALAMEGDQWPDTHEIIKADRRLEIPNLPPSAVAFNPSIARIQDHVVLAFRCDRNDLGWGPHMNIGLAVLDEHLEVKGTPTLFPFMNNDLPFSTAEDPRLVSVDDHLYVTFNAMTDNPWAGRRGLNVAEIFVEDADLPEPKITAPHFSRLTFPADGQTRWVEKNWAPFSYDHQIHFVYQTNPPWIVRVDANQLRQWPQEIAVEEVSRAVHGVHYGFGEMRGGSQALSDEAFGGDYLAFFHGRDHSDYGSGARVHLTIGFYTFAPTPPFGITRLLPYPITIPGLNERKRWDLECAYPGGIMWHNDRLVVAYGHMDDSVHLLELDPNQLQMHSDAIEQPPGADGQKGL